MAKLFLKVCLIASVMFVSACAKKIYAPDADLQKYAYANNEAPSITLLTMINNNNGSGGHSSLMINNGQRIMYDPAGRFKSKVAPERDDVMYGVTPSVLARYKSFHARDTHHVVSQTITVSPEVAAQAMRLAMSQGASHDAMCSINVSSILTKLPGFESINSNWFPAKLSKRFAELPNVVTDKHFENDIGQN